MKFISSLILCQTEEGESQVELADRYINPVARYLRMLFTSEVESTNGTSSRVDLRDKLELVISYDEAQWLSNTLWLKFVNNIRSLIPSFDQEGKCETPADLVRAVGSASFTMIEENLPILEQSLSFTLV